MPRLRAASLQHSWHRRPVAKGLYQCSLPTYRCLGLLCSPQGDWFADCVSILGPHRPGLRLPWVHCP